MTTADLLSVFGLWSAAVFAAFVLLRRKGDWLHRWSGRGYLTAMLVVNGAGLMDYEDAEAWGPMEAMAVASVSAAILGVLTLRVGGGSAALLAVHGHLMAWSIVGLTAAALGAVAERLALPVPPTLAMAFVGGAVIIARGRISRRATRVAERIEVS